MKPLENTRILPIDVAVVDARTPRSDTHLLSVPHGWQPAGLADRYRLKAMAPEVLGLHGLEVSLFAAPRDGAPS